MTRYFQELLIVIAALLFGGAMHVSAQVVINEIMYDLEGSDTGREWVEIANTSGSATDLTDWKLFEGGSNHALTLVNGDGTLLSGGFAVIADNTDKFLLDFPGYSGVLFDSSFSFSNTGESLTIRDGALADIDSVSYTNAWGAQGDGNSLQRTDSSWIAAAPTPGASNGTTPVPPAPPPEDTGSGGDTQFEVDQKYILADAGGDRKVIVGAGVVFEGRGTGTTGEPMENAEYHWNFGDGTTARGQTILHTYRFPGEYVVILTVISGKYSASDGLRVVAEPSQLSITRVTPGPAGAIEVRNGSAYELDVSLWILRAGEQHFIFPKGTHILPGRTVPFPAAVTGLAPASASDVTLLYPNGEIAYQSPKSAESMDAEIAGAPPASSLSQSAASPVSRVASAETELFEDATVAGTTTAAETPTLVLEDAAASAQGSDLGTWLTVLVGVMLIGAGGVLFIGRKGRSDIARIADEIKIVEE